MNNETKIRRDYNLLSLVIKFANDLHCSGKGYLITGFIIIYYNFTLQFYLPYSYSDIYSLRLEAVSQSM